MKIFILPFIFASTNALWFPHLTPRAYENGEELKIFAGQLRSDHASLPFDFYKLSWCDSVDGHAYDPDSIGVTMRDIKFVTSPYTYKVGTRQVGGKVSCT